MGVVDTFHYEKDSPMTILLVRIFLFTLPFQFALNPVPGVDLHVSRIFSIAIFLFWLTESLFKKSVHISFSRTTLFLSSFVFIASVSFLWANQETISLRKSSFFLSFFPLFFVFSSIVKDGGYDTVRSLSKSLFFGSVLTALIGIVQFALPIFFGVGPTFHFWISTVLPPFLGSSFSSVVAEYPSLLANIGGTTMLRASAFFPDPHMFAYFMGMALPIGFPLFSGEKEPYRKRMYGFLLLVVLVADLLSFSRGAYLGLVFAGIGLIFLLLRGNSSKKMILWSFLILSSLSLVFFTGNPVRERFFSSFSFEEGSNQGRIAMWEEAVMRIEARPFLGYGLGNYPFAVKPDASPRDPIYAHNLLLDIATETGIIGMLLFLLAFVSAFLTVLEGYPLIALSFLVFFGHSLVESPLYSVHVFPVLLLLLSFGSVSRRE